MKLKNKNIMERLAAASTFVKKKIRSRRSRRRRSQVAPFVLRNQTVDLSVHSSSCSYFFDANDVSCDSSGFSNPKKRSFDVIQGGYGAKNQGNEGAGESQFTRITRSHYEKGREAIGNEVEVLSESSCVESNSGADFRLFCERSSKLKKTSDSSKEIERNDAVSVAVTQSDVSCIEVIHDEISKLSSKFKENDLVSSTSGFEFCSTSNFDTAVEDNENDVVDANFTVSNSKFLSLEEVVSDYSSSHRTLFSELQSIIFPESSDLDFSDYTPLLYDSGSQFSDQKSTDESPTSLTYSLFLDFKQQFSRSTSPLDPKFASSAVDECQLYPTLVRFEDEEDEESYKRFRERERRQVFLRDYAEEYRFTTDHGDLILQQRSFMIRWIVEQSTAKEFQQETIFLGVSLLDRFLSKGFFKSRRSLQIVGIACLTLATRLEENQPYNSVRQKNFYIGSNKYSRNEVVAMERLVMECLNFQCFLPTIYNFLWFYLKAAKADAEVEKRAKYLAVVALLDHKQLRYWPSTVAAAIVIMASMDANQHGSYHQVIEIHMRTKDNDLPECMTSLDWLVQYLSCSMAKKRALNTYRFHYLPYN
ncbi:Cyclin-SDS-like [Hibiscus syriacus]|uniref:Cyclin-SDS-like n=1 Tax=Hibiscus syriacus TaxID=106335 RepID=A0A6A2XW28_HIBSY|nr:Cyclin-SDS-like [Hibiscus syriacus]